LAAQQGKIAYRGATNGAGLHLYERPRQKDDREFREGLIAPEPVIV
jgi:hypothetical protein